MVLVWVGIHVLLPVLLDVAPLNCHILFAHLTVHFYHFGRSGVWALENISSRFVRVLKLIR